VSDLIHRLLEVEGEARKIIADAEQQAAQTLSRATEQARRIRAQAREEGRREAERFLEQASEALRERHESQIEKARAGLPSPESVDREQVKKAVRFIVDVITGLEAN